MNHCKEPILVIMAAGMGSRYGGLKQIDPVGENGELIIDYSLFDAYDAGFRRVICIIKPEIETDFRELMKNRIPNDMEVHYAFQRSDDLPAGFALPQGRVKPWGTGHAVLSCRDLVNAPFCVINADDYYGAEAFQLMYGFLSTVQESNRYSFAMVGYILENTLTENGHVARGVCTVESGYLAGVRERTHIEKRIGGAAYTEDNGKTWVSIPQGSIVSMNFWGFTPGMLRELADEFPVFLKKALLENPLKAEYFLPEAVNRLLSEGRAEVAVFPTREKWYGVTYQKDKPIVVDALQQMTASGKYPSPLWKGREK